MLLEVKLGSSVIVLYIQSYGLDPQQYKNKVFYVQLILININGIVLHRECDNSGLFIKA